MGTTLLILYRLRVLKVISHGNLFIYVLLIYVRLEVFAAVHASSVSFGVVPFENSTNGSVIDTLDLLADREAKFADVLVGAEVYCPVRHCLLGHIVSSAPAENGENHNASLSCGANGSGPSSPRSADLTHVTRIFSHVQAFGQCRAFLSRHLPGIDCQEVSSTSRAAGIVAADSSGTSVAIASSLAASIHHLDILADGIQDRDDNATRFFILHKASQPVTTLPGLERSDTGDRTKWKSLVAFSIQHEMSGALAGALLAFKIFGLNLTSINSRPSRLRPWHYIFLIECDDKREEDGSGAVNEVLKRLNQTTSDWRWLGSWLDML